ncbi:MAG: HNH endonuclease [Methylococcales bacterium]|nr:HNH endonuclease [Methylococcales bacterium]
MNEKIDQIRELLSTLEEDLKNDQEKEFSKNFSALELPSIVSSIVDFLHPLLTPYEIAVYWYLFNKSIVKTGEQYTHASTRGMSSIAKSASGKSDNISYRTIQVTLESLIEKEVLSLSGDTTRSGTLYKICILDEIHLCKEQMKAQVFAEEQSINLEIELDFYNIAENRLKVFERDGYKCHYCNKQLTRFSATLDHIQPVSKSGDNSFQNLITACLHCNSERGNKPIMDYVVTLSKSD